MTRLITLLIIRSLDIIKVSSITQMLTVILRMLITCYGNYKQKTHSDRINNTKITQDTRDDADARGYESIHVNNMNVLQIALTLMPTPALLSAVNVKTNAIY